MKEMCQGFKVNCNKIPVLWMA